MSRCAFLVLFCAAVAGAAPPARLAEDWNQRLGPVEPAAGYSSAVCPDGTYYLADRHGGLIVVGPGGEIVARRAAEAELVRARLLACDAGGRLYAAGPGGLTALQPGPWGALSVAVRLGTPVRQIMALAPGPAGTLYALGTVARGHPTRMTDRLPLHALDRAGRLLFSFGRPQPGMIVMPRVPAGWLVWDAIHARLLHIPRDEYELRVYDSRGRLLEVVTRQPRRYIHPAQLEVPRQVSGAAALPDGRLVVQARTEGPRGGTYIDLYGADLHLEQSGLEFPGLLAGADADGGLYFTNMTRAGITVARAKIEEPGRRNFRAGRAPMVERRTTPACIPPSPLRLPASGGD